MADGTTSALDAEPHALPHNIEAEQALLGALLVNNDVYDRIAAIVQAAHFFDPVHARIFEVAAERIRRNALATPCHHQGLLRGGCRPPRTRRPGLSRPPRRRRDLALRRQGLCPAHLRPRDPPRVDPDRPGHRAEGHPHGGRQRGQGPDRRGRAGALPARRAGQGRSRLPDLPPRRHRRGPRRQRRLRTRRRPGRHLHRPRPTSTRTSAACTPPTF